jgi:UDP-2,4-diacetamido-2,4,6-trideoxy-beta-L-altropyranose hydrolase
MKSPILIRADASATIGTGHVMRCLALAQACQRAGARAVFAGAEMPPDLKQRLEAEGIEIVSLAVDRGCPDDAARTVELARSLEAAWIVADGYAFGGLWQKQIKDAGFRLLVIDDYGHAEHYHADLILNQNASAGESLYLHRDPTTHLLLGPRYSLLRNEFLVGRDAKRVNPPVARKILVTMGGSDANNMTVEVIEALALLPDIEAVIVVGVSNPHLQKVKQAIEARSSTIRLVVNATNMPVLMNWADLAISAAGSTAWELAYMGLPSALIITADNQLGIAEELARESVSLNWGPAESFVVEHAARALCGLLSDHSRREELSRAGRRLVDGSGADRVLLECEFFA